mmetsp:Transcript_26335/g.67084  ORF Transcript_26335/g.67084 Transcript_26335/m.67084 type:complete len:244 (-) Transcript_26335:4217-4948(-)
MYLVFCATSSAFSSSPCISQFTMWMSRRNVFVSFIISTFSLPSCTTPEFNSVTTPRCTITASRRSVTTPDPFTSTCPCLSSNRRGRFFHPRRRASRKRESSRKASSYFACSSSCWRMKDWYLLFASCMAACAALTSASLAIFKSLASIRRSLAPCSSPSISARGSTGSGIDSPSLSSSSFDDAPEKGSRGDASSERMLFLDSLLVNFLRLNSLYRASTNSSWSANSLLNSLSIALSSCCTYAW